MKKRFGLLIEDKDVSPFVVASLCEVMAVNLKKYFLDSPTSCFYFVKKNLFWYADIKKWDVTAQKIVKDVVARPKKYEKFNLQMRESIDDLKSFSKMYYDINLTSLSLKELLSLFLLGIKKYKNVYERGIIPTITDLHKPFLTNALKLHLQDFFSSGLDSNFISLTTPFEISEMLKEEKELISIAIKNRINNKTISSHVKKYFWLTFGYEGPEYSVKAAEDRIKSIRRNKKNSLERLSEIVAYSRGVKTKIKSLEKNGHLDERTKEIFKIAREWVYCKGARKEAFFMCYALFDKIAIEMSRRFYISKDEIKYLTFSESVKLLKTGQLPKNLNYRLLESIYIYRNGQINSIPKSKILKFVNNSFIADYNGDSELKGQVAFPGVVTGIAKIIQAPADMHKLNKGEILISSQTNPNLVAAMAMASAFVTDMGGITCHASIVAREMKKPCIIGTKIATKVIKDGDLIEVDANKGIVRIIKKA